MKTLFLQKKKRKEKLYFIFGQSCTVHGFFEFAYQVEMRTMFGDHSLHTLHPSVHRTSDSSNTTDANYRHVVTIKERCSSATCLNGWVPLEDVSPAFPHHLSSVCSQFIIPSCSCLPLLLAFVCLCLSSVPDSTYPRVWLILLRLALNRGLLRSLFLLSLFKSLLVISALFLLLCLSYTLLFYEGQSRKTIQSPRTTRPLLERCLEHMAWRWGNTESDSF